MNRSNEIFPNLPSEENNEVNPPAEKDLSFLDSKKSQEHLESVQNAGDAQREGLQDDIFDGSMTDKTEVSGLDDAGEDIRNEMSKLMDLQKDEGMMVQAEEGVRKYSGEDYHKGDMTGTEEGVMKITQEDVYEGTLDQAEGGVMKFGDSGAELGQEAVEAFDQTIDDNSAELELPQEFDTPLPDQTPRKGELKDLDSI